MQSFFQKWSMYIITFLLIIILFKTCSYDSNESKRLAKKYWEQQLKRDSLIRLLNISIQENNRKIQEVSESVGKLENIVLYKIENRQTTKPQTVIINVPSKK